jgi:hypothetical protein
MSLRQQRLSLVKRILHRLSNILKPETREDDKNLRLPIKGAALDLSDGIEEFEVNLVQMMCFGSDGA